jgi:hypothetical protein
MAKVKWFGRKVLKETLKQTEIALRESALFVMADAIQNVAVDTGMLRNSIDWDQDGQKAVVYAGMDYAAHVELGTSNPNYPIQPYLRPALFNNLKTIEALFRNRLP